MPFSELFRARRPGGDAQGAGLTGEAASDKLAVIGDLERSGVSWFWATDAAGRVTYLSDAVASACGRREGARGLALQSLLAPVSGEGDGRSLGLRLGTRKPFASLLVETVGGEPADRLILRLGGRPVFDAAGEFTGFCGSALDVTEEYRSEEEASRLAQFDSLTGLANRYRMTQRIDATLAAFRASKRACALFMLDLDR